jgi:hypothetical protein
MIALLGTLLGFGTSIVPEVLGYFKQNQANKQEMAMLEAKAKYAAQLSDLKIKELDAQAEIAETAVLDSGSFVNALRGSVRPVITYLFFALFAAIKGAMVYAMIVHQNIDWSTALANAWDDETAAIFSAIMAFWFGNRLMSKARAYQMKKRK